MKPLTLIELNQKIRSGIHELFPDTYWILAEISECKENYSGHCYLELIQKNEGQDSICARARAVIWARTWGEIGPYFERETGARLSAGQQILAEVSVDFHELYGMSLTIRNIDPSYTIGNQELKRRQIIRQLESDGVIDQNKELTWPVLPQKIAVISSSTAAGFQDFMRQLHDNVYGFVFYTALFPAVMQGESAAQSIIDALDRIIECGVDFDAVVIIRGGGAAADLSCFDQYDLCYFCTQFPLPILTGLGHDKDFSVLDRVANTSVKTPTATAEFIIDSVLQQSFRLENNADELYKRVSQVLENNKIQLQTLPVRLQSLIREHIHSESMKHEKTLSFLRLITGQILMKSLQRTEMAAVNIKTITKSVVERNIQKLELDEKLIRSYSPETILNKGFSVTMSEGRVIKLAIGIKSGMRLETRFKDGTVRSITEKNEENDKR